MKLGEGSAVVTVAVAAVVGILAVSRLAELVTYAVIGGVIYLGRQYYTRKIDKLQTQFSDYKAQIETSKRREEAKVWLMNRENSN
jgi:AmiR/NasT family two-component response regulator